MASIFPDKISCTGCSACSFICKAGAIKMEKNNEGFEYPVIDKQKCINCGACKSVCNKSIERDVITVSNVYAFQAKDSFLLFNSSSGGFIPVLAQYIVDNGGVYFATVYDDARKEAFWDTILKSEDIKKASGSKYFQIPLNKRVIGELLKSIKSRIVLFVGTPCQVEAVKKLTPKSYINNLIAVDLVCGGVQSYKLEKEYKAYLEKNEGSEVVSHKFRSKDKGWTRKYLSVVMYSDGERQQKLANQDLFLRAFNSGNYLRRSCYNCAFNGRERVGDISVGDCWGIETNEQSSFAKSKGVSLVCINNLKGKTFFEFVANKGEFENVDEKTIIENKPLNQRSFKSHLRAISYKLIGIFPFKMAINIICYKYMIRRLLGR